MESLKEDNKKLKKKIKSFEKKDNIIKEDIENQKEEIKKKEKFFRTKNQIIKKILKI